MRALLALLPLFLPLAAAQEPLCLPTCSVESTEYGYTPATTVVTSGATVTWSSLDVQAHTATSGSFCLDATISPDQPGSATFDVVDGQLSVLNQGTTIWRACDEAEPLPDGAFALAYLCLFHQTLQKAVLVVAPG